MKVKYWSWLAILASTGAYASVVDSFNIGLPLQNNQNGDNCCVNGDTDIGWYYTPSVSYLLTGLETIYDNLSSADPTVTFAVYTDRPSNGGTLLGSANYTPSPGVLGGQSGFLAAPVFLIGIPLVGGTTYFIGEQNVFHLGVSQVTFESTGVEGTPPGSVAPGAAWGDTDGSVSFSASNCSDLNNWFCKPEIEFLTPNAAPEPAPMEFVGVALGALVLSVRRRLRGKLAQMG